MLLSLRAKSEQRTEQEVFSFFFFFSSFSKLKIYSQIPIAVSYKLSRKSQAFWAFLTGVKVTDEGACVGEMTGTGSCEICELAEGGVCVVVGGGGSSEGGVTRVGGGCVGCCCECGCDCCDCDCDCDCGCDC